MTKRVTINPNIIITSIVALVIVGVVIAVLIKVTKKNRLARKAEKEYENELTSQIYTSELTLSTTDFKDLANKFYRAVKGLGTNFPAVLEVFNELTTDSDLKQLTKTFGVRDNMTLAEWIYDDLRNSQIQRLNKLLEDKGINYRY